jgi:ABC-type nickel/cobalt efflux system permease component RcnA
VLSREVAGRFSAVHAMALLAAVLLCSAASFSHPMGNFSISHYAGIRLEDGYVEIRYVIDEAEIPTFQEMQRTGLRANVNDPSVAGYLREQAEGLKAGLTVTLDGQPISLETVSTEVIFPPGAGGLPTMKLGLLYRASLAGMQPSARHQLHYRDDNFRDRAGWKEIVIGAAPQVPLLSASVPVSDRSAQLTNYPTDLLNSPPQDLEADAAFTVSSAVAHAPSADVPPVRPARVAEKKQSAALRLPATGEARAAQTKPEASLALKANQQATPRNAFTELIGTRQLSFSIVAFAALVALSLGGLHALEPGHGKTLVAAYLVGSRGTALHALLLGLIVTFSHTVGVFLLGAVTLYAQKYVVPEQLYPWLGVVSGLIIALLGFCLLLQRYLGFEVGQLFTHSHGGYRHGGFGETSTDEIAGPETGAAAGEATRQVVTFRQLLALGITGGMVPCPAALVVLLSAVALHRVGFGLFLIVVFSAGLAGVLIATGMLVVYAGRFLVGRGTQGRLIQRWLPIASATAVTALGLVIALRALLSAGILPVRL